MFKVLGTDGKEYGPVSVDQLKQWISEGRANRETMVQREGDSGWKPLGQHAEFAGVLNAPGPIGAPAPSAAPGPADPGGRARAEQMVSGPAIGLIITGSLGIVAQILGILSNLLGIGAGMMSRGNAGMPPAFERLANLTGGAVGVLLSIIGIGVGAFIIYGALQMKNLTRHGLALAAAIVAMVPCVSPCCWLGLPIGIWAVVVLSKPEVKSHFN